jgi:predicted glycosyltransferase
MYARTTPPSDDATAARTFRILLYSHDTFGLGHLRRSRTIAAALAEADPRISALILTGSPVAGRFTFPQRVDHIRLPGVTKLQDGGYSSSSLGLDIDETTDLRAGLIETAAARFDPDLLIVDKEPTGFRSELMPALALLRARGKAKLVLGLRDVLDAPGPLAEEWERKGATEAVSLYDEIWVYGLRHIYDPTQGLRLPPQVQARMHWTGYLRREVEGVSETPERPYILVTPGGGGDGEAMIDIVLRAYEADRTLAPTAYIVYGPFLAGDTRQRFEERVAALDGRVRSVGFDSRMESVMANAAGVVAMGGYNTFCEILSFDRPAVIVPRELPRLEQTIRASRAQELGLVRMLDGERAERDPGAMAAAIRALATQPPPSAAHFDGLLDGLPRIVERVEALLRSPVAA